MLIEVGFVNFCVDFFAVPLRGGRRESCERLGESLVQRSTHSLGTVARHRLPRGVLPTVRDGVSNTAATFMLGVTINPLDFNASVAISALIYG